MPIMKSFSSQEHQNTVWYNPTDKVVSAMIWEGPESSPTPWLHFQLAPGEEASLPSKYDRAIKIVNKNGEVMGGKAPQLLTAAEKAKLEAQAKANSAVSSAPKTLNTK